MDSSDRPAAPPPPAEKPPEEAPVIEVELGASGRDERALRPKPELAAASVDEAPLLDLSEKALEDIHIPRPSPVPRFDMVPIAVSRAPSMWKLGVIAFLVAAADLGTKEWATRALAGPDLKRSAKHFEVIKDHLDFIFAQNPGGAWSFLRSVPDGLRRPFFLFVSAAAIVFIITVYRRLEPRQWAMSWGLPLALGGAIGNLADRVRYGWVVDFVDVYTKRGDGELHWPTFNVADIAIVVGVGLMALDLLSLRRSKQGPDRAPETAGDAA
jgi:signal peptidase II